MIKTRTWVIGIALILLLSVCTVLWMRQENGTTDMTAEISLDGECIETIDLSAVTVPYSFTVEGENGKNIISVEPGRICVREADCPDQVCVHQGWQSDGAVPIVCLPNKLVIQLVPTEADEDKEFNVNGVVQ